MIKNPKWLSLLLGNCILIFVMQLINNGLGALTINIYINALFLFIPILLVPYSTGLLSVIITSCILDASALFPFGTSTVLFSLVYTVYFWIYQRFKSHSDLHNMLLLQSANAITFSLMSVFINSSNYSNFYFWASILLNLFFSQILLLFITRWFLSLQYSLLNCFAFKSQFRSG